MKYDCSISALKIRLEAVAVSSAVDKSKLMVYVDLLRMKQTDNKTDSILLYPISALRGKRGSLDT
jgi:hypothetical protein